MADDLLTTQLQGIGFARIQRGIYERDTSSSEVRGWLGLNQSLAEGVRLFPFIGVRQSAVEEMLRHLGATAYSSPLATVQLGYLMPDESARWWIFQGEIASDEAAARDLVANVKRFALPFFESNHDLPTLAESVRSNVDEDARAYALPVVYRLMEQPQLAEQALDAGLLADKSGAGSTYRSFVERFMGT